MKRSQSNRIILTVYLFVTSCYVSNATNTEFTQTLHPDLLSGLQVLQSVENTITRLSTAILCVDTPECVGFVYSMEMSYCRLLEGQPLGKEAYVYEDGDIVYLAKAREIKLLGYRVSTNVSDSPIAVLDDVAESGDMTSAGDLETPLAETFKHPVMERWSDLNIIKVELTLRTATNDLVTVTFDTTLTSVNKITWMNKAYLLSSPWTDLSPTSSANFFSVHGDFDRRRFFINKLYAGCDGDFGWLVMVTGLTGDGDCGWETHPIYPAILFSNATHAVNWLDNANIGLATDLMIILVIKT